MKGLLKKEFLMLKSNSKALAITLILFVVYTIGFSMDMTYFLPFMALMLAIASFAYDDYNNWHTYAASLPNGKINFVKARYIFTLIMLVLTTTIGVVVGYAINSSSSEFILKEFIFSSVTTLFIFTMIGYIIFPIFFKFGAEKGRLSLLALGLITVGIGYLFNKYVSIDSLDKLMEIIYQYVYLIYAVAVIVIGYISYFISKKIYLKREF